MIQQERFLKTVEYLKEHQTATLNEIAALPDRMMVVLPLYHILALAAVLHRLVYLQNICIGRGSRYVIADIPKLNPSFIPMVPFVLESLVKLLKSTVCPATWLQAQTLPASKRLQTLCSHKVLHTNS